MKQVDEITTMTNTTADEVNDATWLIGIHQRDIGESEGGKESV